jgi:hypothetical protein
MGFAMAAVAASDTARVMERIDAMIPVFDIIVHSAPFFIIL